MRRMKKSRRAQLGLRAPESLRRKLEKAAERHGVSMNTEVVNRLEQSFEIEDRLGGPAVAGLVEAIGLSMKYTGEYGALLEDQTADNSGRWLERPYAYDQAVKAANTILEANRPPGKVAQPVWTPLGRPGQLPGVEDAKLTLRMNRMIENLGAVTAKQMIMLMEDQEIEELENEK